MKIKLIYCMVVACSLLSVGCLKLEVKPKNMISDSVDAGKDLYRTIKMRSNGQEERKYSYVIRSDDEKRDGENVNLCFSKIRSLAEDASLKKPSFYDQESEVNLIEGQRSIKCSLVALVKPKR